MGRGAERFKAGRGGGGTANEGSEVGRGQPRAGEACALDGQARGWGREREKCLSQLARETAEKEQG